MKGVVEMTAVGTVAAVDASKHVHRCLPDAGAAISRVTPSRRVSIAVAAQTPQVASENVPKPSGTPRRRIRELDAMRLIFYSVVGSAAMGLLSGCERRDERASAAAPERLIEKWTARFDQDNQFQQFATVLLTGDRVLLLDQADARVTALSLETGQTLWTRGQRGAGPGEFLVPDDLVYGGDGRFGVADNRQGRVTFFSDTAFGETVTLRLEGQLNSYCQELSGTTLAIKFGEMVLVRLREDTGPEALDSIRWPVPQYNEFIVLRQARFARSREGRCVIWQPMGDFFFEVQPSSPSVKQFRRYAESLPVPRIDRSGTTPRLLKGPSAAKDAAILSDSLFLLRGSSYTGPGALVDVYSLDNGQRVKSLLLPNADAFQIDVTNGLLIVHRSTDNGSIISAYVRP
ncbi:hypothetical protein [Gemmatimonas sp.]|uniref:hypothetical protein n=1 Tax=Gemmatimonas sp. TaxID=1962908 RepID=UPI0037BFE91E